MPMHQWQLVLCLQAVQQRQQEAIKRKELQSRLKQAAALRKETQECGARAAALQHRGSNVRKVLAMQGQALLEALQLLQVGTETTAMTCKQ